MIVGVLVLGGVGRILSDDDRLVRKLFEAQPVTMVAATTAVGSVIAWALMEALRLW